MIIDAHVYCVQKRLCNPKALLPLSEKMITQALYRHPDTPRVLNRCLPSDILRSMKKAGIDKAVLVALPWKSARLCRENNDFIFKTVAQYNCFMPVCSVQPTNKTCLKEVERCFKNGAIGIKVNPVWQDFSLDDKAMNVLAQYVVQKKRFLMIHVDHAFKNTTASPAQLYTFAQQHPHLKILAAHLGGLIGLNTLHTPSATVLKNVWFDTAVSSTLSFVKWYIEVGLENKIVFGTDFPFNHSHSQKQVLKDLRTLKMPLKIQRKIFSQNFLNLIEKT